MADLSSFRTSEATSATDTAKTAVKAQSPGAAWIFDEPSGKWVKPAAPSGSNKVFTWNDDKGWVQTGVDTSAFQASTGFALTKVLLDDPVYGKGPKGLQNVYDLWEAGDETAALNAYFQSDYYTKLGKTAASRFALSKNQPEVYKADLDTYTATQKRRLSLLGVKVNDEELNQWIKTAYDSNLNDIQLDALVAKSTDFGKSFAGTTLGQLEEFKQYARSFGLSYDNSKYNQWGADLFTGKITDAEIKVNIQQEAASAYPALADQILKGVSVDALASAYKSSMATILEIDADSIGYNDPTLRKALQSVGPDGKPTTKPLWQFESDLRNDPRWQFTNNARDTVDSLSLKVLRDWGMA